MKSKRLGVFVLIMLTLLPCYAEQYYVGEDVTDLKIIASSGNPTYVTYIQEGGLKALVSDSDGELAPLTLFADGEPVPVDIVGLEVTMLTNLCYIGETDDGVTFFWDDFGSLGISNRNTILLPVDISSIHDIQFVSNFSYGLYCFVTDADLWGVSIDFINHKILYADILVHNLKDSYSLYPEKNEIFCLGVTNTNSVNVLTTIGSPIHIFDEQFESFEGCQLMTFPQNELFLSVIDDCNHTVFKFSDNVFNKYNILDKTFIYPNMARGNMNEFCAVRAIDNSTWIIQDNLQTEVTGIKLIATPLTKNSCMILAQNDDWELLISDYKTTEIYSLPVSFTSRFLFIDFDQNTVLFYFLDEKTESFVICYYDVVNHITALESVSYAGKTDNSNFELDNVNGHTTLKNNEITCWISEDDFNFLNASLTDFSLNDNNSFWIAEYSNRTIYINKVTK